MTRIDLFLRAGGHLDPNTWSMMDDRVRQQAANYADELRADLAGRIADAVMVQLTAGLGIDADSMAQQVAEMMAAEVKA